MAKTIESFAPRTHVVNKEHPNWVPTSDIAAKLRSDYEGLSFPWLEKEHLHGVNSIVTGLCHKHNQIVPMVVGNLWRGLTKYGCPECARELGYDCDGSDRFAHKRRAPNFDGRSKSEFDLFCAVKEVFPDALSGHRLKGGKEIDIWVPSIHMGIEFNGVYWHSSAVGKDRAYHYEKTKLANRERKGIFHLFPEEAQDVDRVIRLLLICKEAFATGDRVLPPKTQLQLMPVSADVAAKFHNMYNFNNTRDQLIHTDIAVMWDDNPVAMFGVNVKESIIVKASYAVTFTELGGVLELIAKFLNKPSILLLTDLRNPLEIRFAEGSGLVPFGDLLDPTIFRFSDDGLGVRRNLTTVNDLISDPGFNEPITWDCGGRLFGTKLCVKKLTKIGEGLRKQH